MNVRDAEALAGRFVAAGYSVADHAKDADVIMVLTCAVREHAENRAIAFTRSLSSLKKSQTSNLESRIPGNKSPVICFLGCVAKEHGERLKKEMPYVDLIAGPSELDKVFDFVVGANPCVRPVLVEDRQRDENFYSTEYTGTPGHAQVVISTGCSNWCTYCIVPYVRGPIIHRDPDDIIAEVRSNVEKGRTKITLLGQNVNDYDVGARLIAPSGYTFIDLLKEVAAVPGVEEIDFTSSHPKNQSIELFEVMRDLPNVKNHLHMAMQSGSTKILRAMNRGYSKEQLLDIVTMFKEITNGTIGTDIIVGFPGETEEDFADTVDVVKKAGFNYAYIFMYSPRPHSRAFNLKDDVPQHVKKKRHALLLELQKKISAGIKV